MSNGILGKAIETYGEVAQLDMCIEEMSELTKAICKLKRESAIGVKEYATLDNLFEEIADVRIMIEQLLIMFDCHAEVSQQVEYKINRLKERLGCN